MKNKSIIAMNNKIKDAFRKRLNKKLKNKLGITFKEYHCPKDKRDENSILVPPIKSHKRVQIGMQKN